MFGQRPPLEAGERWESDRGVRVEIFAVSGRTVVFELVGTTLGCVALDRGLFARIFRNRVPPRDPEWPANTSLPAAPAARPPPS